MATTFALSGPTAKVDRLVRVPRLTAVGSDRVGRVPDDGRMRRPRARDTRVPAPSPHSSPLLSEGSEWSEWSHPRARARGSERSERRGAVSASIAPYGPWAARMHLTSSGPGRAGLAPARDTRVPTSSSSSRSLNRKQRKWRQWSHTRTRAREVSEGSLRARFGCLRFLRFLSHPGAGTALALPGAPPAIVVARQPS